jgi:hypothetical protein
VLNSGDWQADLKGVSPHQRAGHRAGCNQDRGDASFEGEVNFSRSGVQVTDPARLFPKWPET